MVQGLAANVSGYLITFSRLMAERWSRCRAYNVRLLPDHIRPDTAGENVMGLDPGVDRLAARRQAYG
jgi:hypothetical protein